MAEPLERQSRAEPPEVSIVIPTYRGGELLLETVASVVAQELQAWELVVVLDGCPLPQPWPDDPRVRVVPQRNRGVSVARNVGLAASSAEFVAFIDDDDLMLPARLGRQVELLARRPELGMAHSQFEVIDAAGAVVQAGRSSNVQYADLLRGDVDVLMPTTMFRREALIAVGTFNSTLRTGQDLELIYRVAREYPIGFDDAVLTRYRRHPGNVSGDALQAGINLERILDAHLEWATSHDQQEAAAAARQGIAWARRYGSMGAMLAARAAWRAGDRLACARALGVAVRTSPRQAIGDVIGNRLVARRVTR